MQRFDQLAHSKPGDAPGIELDELGSLPAGAGPVHITCVDYSPNEVSFQEVDNLDDFVGQHRPAWTRVRWISVDGLSDRRAIQLLASKYDLHPLAVEDMFQRTHRAKVESYGGEDTGYQARLFVVVHAVNAEGGRLLNEQISIFLGHNTVLTFQENRSTEWDPLRQRIKAKGARVRNYDASFLVYSLLDALVDNYFPILETYGDRAEELETQILERSDRALVNQIHLFKRDLLQLRWVVWPMREMIAVMQREPHECVSETTQVYLRDLYDHLIQIIELNETYREIAGDLIETHMTAVSNRMNEIMKVLTVIGTIFIPLTFLAGVYGMNFRYIPEFDQPWAYPVFWLICIVTAISMIVWFRRRGWI